MMGPPVPENCVALPESYYIAFDSIAEASYTSNKGEERGVLKDDVLDIILANNRLPNMMRPR
jgi:hypothetical protein